MIIIIWILGHFCFVSKIQVAAESHTRFKNPLWSEERLEETHPGSDLCACRAISAIPNPEKSTTAITANAKAE